jgi:foldase protein PrsA
MLYSPPAGLRERGDRGRRHSMRSRIPLLSLVALVAAPALLLAGCGGGGGALSAQDVATVDGQPITIADFNKELRLEQRMAKASKQSFPKQGTSAYAQRKQQIVQLLVEQKAYEIKARQAGIKVTDKQVQASLDSLRKSRYGGSEKAFEKAMNNAGVTRAEVEDAARFSLLVDALKQKIDASVSVSPAEIKTYYEQHKSSFVQPESRQLAHILVKTKAQAESIYAQLEKGASFSALAKKYSTDTTSAKTGGKLVGCCTKGQLVSAFEKVAYALKTGQISKPVHTTYGWHIIKALSPVKPAHLTPFSDEQSAIRAQLLQSRQSEAETKWQTDFTSWMAKVTKYQQGYAPTTTSQAGQLTTTTAP